MFVRLCEYVCEELDGVRWVWSSGGSGGYMVGVRWVGVWWLVCCMGVGGEQERGQGGWTRGR